METTRIEVLKLGREEPIEEEPDFSQQEALATIVPDVLDGFKDLDVALGIGAVAYATEDTRRLVPLAFAVAEMVSNEFKTSANVVVEYEEENGALKPQKIRTVTVSDASLKEVGAFICARCILRRYLYGSTQIVCGENSATLQVLVDEERYRELLDKDEPHGKRLFSSHMAQWSTSEGGHTELSQEVLTARQAAKSIVAFGFAHRCVVKLVRWKQGQVNYFVHTFGTGKVPDREISELLLKKLTCDLSPKKPTTEEMFKAMRKDCWQPDEIQPVDLDPVISPMLRLAQYDCYGDLDDLSTRGRNHWAECQLPLKELRNGWRFWCPETHNDGPPLFRPCYRHCTGKVRPFPISPRLEVPNGICGPEWALDGQVSEDPNKYPKVRNSQDIASLRNACRIAKQVLDEIQVRPGMTTDEIDKFVHKRIIASGAYPSFLNFQLYPKSCFTSVNEIICNGLPDCWRLQDGDIVNVEVAVYLGSMHGMASRTFLVGVGKPTDLGSRLIKCSEECIAALVKEAKPGLRYKRLKTMMSQVAASHGFVMSGALPPCSGIGERLYCAPGYDTVNTKVHPGHTFTIEAQINVANGGYMEWVNGARATRDGKPNAALKHTVLMTDNGLEVLTI